jgi:hypothetical protein
MKLKTSELTGPALDWAVASAMGFEARFWAVRGDEPEIDGTWEPSTDWEEGGPIIERENIGVTHDPDHVFWEASVWLNPDKHMPLIANGPTPLIAAMRCYVASQLGDEVDVPEELT